MVVRFSPVEVQSVPPLRNQYGGGKRPPSRLAHTPRHALQRRHESDTRNFRPEIQGLRSLAVLMVVTYHIFLDRVSGGVDIFLMISAFLLTLSFVRRVETGRRVDLRRHWLHRFKRLVPAASVTVVLTLAAAWVLLPSSRWPEVIDQAIASLFYYENWLLAARSVDYYAADDSLASPFQHFWSLAIQGQVFILWPLIFVASAWVARRLHCSYRGVVAIVFTAVFLSSLTFSVIQTATNQSVAYFDTRARLWEFAAGSLLALALPYLRLRRWVRVLMTWIGVVAIIACGLVLPVEQAFPGYVALWPIIAAAMVIAAGETRSRIGLDRLLTWKPLVRMGDSSYALYLLHWPILVIYLAVADRPSAPLGPGLAIGAASVLGALVIHRFVEKPLREATWTEVNRRRMTAVVAACVSVAVLPASVWQYQLHRQSEQARLAVPADNPGAAVLDEDFTFTGDPSAPTLPLGTELSSQWVSLGERCGPDFAPADRILIDTCGQTPTVASPEKTIVIVGDSHAEQWMAPTQTDCRTGELAAGITAERGLCVRRR